MALYQLPLHLQRRRAKSGMGARAKKIQEELWFANQDITHHVIAGSAGNPESAKLRKMADRRVERLTAEYITITHPPKDPS